MATYLIFSIVTIVLIFSVVVYSLSKNVLKQKSYRYLSYSDKAIRSQLFNLSKLMVVSVVVLALIVGTHMVHRGFQGKYLIPLAVLLYWYCQYKLEPSSFTGIFVECADSGLKAPMYSTERNRTKSIIVQSVGLLYVAIFVIVFVISEVIGTRPYTQEGITTLIGSIDYAINALPKEYSMSLIMAKYAIFTESSFVTFATFLGTLCALYSIISSFAKAARLHKINNKKFGNELKAQTASIIIKKILFNSAILLGYFSILYEVISVKVPQIVIFDDIKNGALLVGTEEYYAQALELYWLPFVTETNAIDLSLICSYLTITLLIAFLLITDIKLLLLYKHQSKMVIGIRIQEDINNGLRPDLSKYKDCDFVENLINYQSLLSRFIYNPSILNNLEGTKKQLSWFVKYIDDIGCCKKCIFMGTPLALTSSISLSLSCYIHQMRFVKDVRKEDHNEKCAEKSINGTSM